MKATTQYFRDTVKNDNTEPTTKPSEGEQLGGDSSVSERETKIHPVPVLFSDAYRWMLVRKEVVVGIDELDREEPVKTYDLGENSFDAAKSYNAAIESNPKQANTSDLQGNDDPLAMQQAETAATYDNESNSSVDNKERAMMQKQEYTVMRSTSMPHLRGGVPGGPAQARENERIRQNNEFRASRLQHLQPELAHPGRKEAADAGALEARGRCARCQV